MRPGSPLAHVRIASTFAAVLLVAARTAAAQELLREHLGNQSGFAAVSFPDLDGDGIRDYALKVGDPYATDVEIRSGASGALLRAIAGIDGLLDSLADAGDVDGDGL